MDDQYRQPADPVVDYASDSQLGERECLGVVADRMGPTQNLNAIWRPALREVRRQPGFGELVRDLGLVDYWRATGDWGDFCRDNGSGSFECS